MTIVDKDENGIRARGMKIQTLSWIGAVICILLLLFVGYNMSRIVNNYKKLVNEFDLHLQSHDYISALQNGSDDMTEQSRLFVVTGEPECMENYFAIVDNHVRENAKEEVEEYFVKMGYGDLVDRLDKALNESDALMDYEIHAMKLMSMYLELNENILPEQVKAYQLPDGENEWENEKKQEYASELVFGTKYRKNKAQIDADIDAAVTAISDKQEEGIDFGVNRMWEDIKYMIIFCVLIAALFATVFTLILILVIRPLRDYAKCFEENRTLPIIGGYEFKNLALTYNHIFEINQETRARMSYEIAHDTLTNAYSRLAFESQKKYLSKLPLPIALLVIDVDHFKNINDAYGHDIGDQALKRVVETMHQLVRDEDIVARIGGDEFAVILRNVYSYSNVIIGEKIDKINEILQNPEDDIPKLSISVGVTFSENGYGEELFKQADKALYKAKTTGRCGYSVYSEDE